MNLKIGDRIKFEIKRKGSDKPVTLTGTIKDQKPMFGDTFIYMEDVSPDDPFIIRKSTSFIAKL